MQDVAQVREGVLTVPLAGDDERVDDGRPLARGRVPDEQPVLLSDGRRPDCILDEVVVVARKE